MKKESRRDFIRSKVVAALLGVVSVPLLGTANSKEDFMSPEDFSFDGDWAKVRNRFPLNRGKIYFNTASLGPSPQQVIDAVCFSMQQLETGAFSGHGHLEDVRSDFAHFLNTDAENLAFTRNATEGMNIVANSLRLQAGDEVLLTRHEHVGGSAPWIALIEKLGIKVKLVDLDLDGKNNLKRIRQSITNRTKVLSFSHITCTTGLCLPVKEIVDLCKRKGVFSCVDGAQALGMIPVDLKALDPDFYIGCGHKWLFGPKGTGVLFMNKRVMEHCTPVFAGAYADCVFDLPTLTLEYKENATREEYGTRNASNVLGLQSAMHFLNTIGMENVKKRGSQLAQRFAQTMAQNRAVEVLTPVGTEHAASIVTIKIKGIDSQRVRNILSRDHKIFVRNIYENAIGGLRVSFSIINSEEDVDRLAAVLNQVIGE